MRVLAAPDKFRGTATAAQVATAVADGVRSVGGRCREVPLSDGGEGFLDVFGGPNRTTVVTGPLGDPVEAGWRLSGKTAVLEMAQASGIALVGGPEGNDAVAAATTGTGELIVAALDAGARRVLVGHGGSASTDGGLGAIRAMFPTGRLRGVELVAAVDVRTVFSDAAEEFAAQKGASATEVELLQRRLDRLGQVYREEHGVDVADMVGSGAAGGLAGGLAAVGATITMGFDLIVEELELDELIEGVDLVVTGEGFIDEASFNGKVVGGLVELAAEMDVPVLAIAGEVFDGVDRRVDTVGLVERFGREAAMTDTLACIRRAVVDHLGRE